MSKSKGKYSPQKVGDNMIIPSGKNEGFFFVTIVTAAIYVFVLTEYLKSQDLSGVLYLLELVAILIVFLGWAHEKTAYVIAPDHIAIKHGPFCRKIQFDQITLYSSNTGNVLFLYLMGGREISIQYNFFDHKAKDYFRGFIERNNIPEKVYPDCLEFKMHVKGAFFFLVTSISMFIALNYVFFLSGHTYTIREAIPVIIEVLFLDPFLIIVAFLSAYTVKVHDKRIDVKNFCIPIKT